MKVHNYLASFGLCPSSGMWKFLQKTTTFRRLDLSPSSGGWGRVGLLSWARQKERVFNINMSMKVVSTSLAGGKYLSIDAGASGVSLIRVSQVLSPSSPPVKPSCYLRPRPTLCCEGSNT
jgi:hypothetical protein